MQKKLLMDIKHLRQNILKIYKACFDGDTNSKYYYNIVCERLFPTFTAIEFFEREDGTRYSYRGTNWWLLENEYGEDGEWHKTLLKYGIAWRNAGGVSDLPLAESYAKSFSNIVCKGGKNLLKYSGVRVLTPYAPLLSQI